MSKTELVDRVKAILQGKGLTLYQCSQQTRNLYGRSSPYFVPHNLYYDLGIGNFQPKPSPVICTEYGLRIQLQRLATSLWI